MDATPRGELNLLALIMRHVAKLSPAGRLWLRQQLGPDDTMERLRQGHHHDEGT